MSGERARGKERHGVDEYEERFSSNYPPRDHYFAGYAENVVINVFDDEIKPGYVYCLSIEKPTYRKGTNRIVDDAAAVASALATAGFRAFVPSGPWGRKGWDGAGEEYAR